MFPGHLYVLQTNRDTNLVLTPTAYPALRKQMPGDSYEDKKALGWQFFGSYLLIKSFMTINGSNTCLGVLICKLDIVLKNA